MMNRVLQLFIESVSNFGRMINVEVSPTLVMGHKWSLQCSVLALFSIFVILFCGLI